MLTCLWISESLGETKINYIHVVLLLANSNQEVVWLDISVEEVARVHKLDSLQLLKVTKLLNRIHTTQSYLPSDLQALGQFSGKTCACSS